MVGTLEHMNSKAARAIPADGTSVNGFETHPAMAMVHTGAEVNSPKPRSIQEHQLYINEAQLILSQKRTSLSILRTGLGIMTLPASVFTILVATSKNYDAGSTLALLIPLGALCVGLVLFGAYLIVKSWHKIRRCDQLVQGLEDRDSLLKELIAD